MKDGVYMNLNIEDYHDNETHESSTVIKPAIRSSLDYKYARDKFYEERRRLTEEERKSHFDFGNAFELALIGDESFKERVFVFDDSEEVDRITKSRPDLKNVRACKEYKEWKEIAMALCPDGAYVVSKTGESESMEALNQMVRNAKNNEVISTALGSVEYQASCFWTDPATGLKLKARPDVVRVNKEVIIDIKTCDDASPHNFQASAHKFDYPFQAVMQIEGAERTGLVKKVVDYYWLAVQKKPPYHAVLYMFDPTDIEMVRERMFHPTLARIARGKETGIYRGFEEQADNKYGILTMDVRDYYYTKYCYSPKIR